jgi:hypothetical protein
MHDKAGHATGLLRHYNVCWGGQAARFTELSPGVLQIQLNAQLGGKRALEVDSHGSMRPRWTGARATVETGG